jgi:hypothetical protein
VFFFVSLFDTRIYLQEQENIYKQSSHVLIRADASLDICHSRLDLSDSNIALSNSKCLALLWEGLPTMRPKVNFPSNLSIQISH